MVLSSPKDDPEINVLFAPDAVQICHAEAPVSEWTIRAWCRAMGDENPVYQDPDAARRYGHKDVFAPPVMMHSFTMPGLIDETEDNIQLRLRRRLAEQHGIISTVAVKYEQEYITPIRLGDRLTRKVRFAPMSDEKVTALGAGYFVKFIETVTNQNGELIGNQATHSYFFRPSGKRSADAKPRAGKTEENVNLENRILLPPLAIPVTTTLIVAGALASNDFEKVHHDRDFAVSQGLQDIIMNILTSSGLAIRYVTDWAGPAAVVKKIVTQLKVPNNPGDVMTLTGWADQPTKSGEPTTVHVTGTNSKGIHMEIDVIIA